jgi:hypothetical protein
MTAGEAWKVIRACLRRGTLLSNPKFKIPASHNFPLKIRPVFSSVKYFSEIFLRGFFRGLEIFPSRKYLYTLRERHRTSFSEEKSLRVRDF